MKIGVLGGGQLGRMLALAGYPLGFQFRCLDPNPEAPLGHLADLMVGSFDDTTTLEAFSDGLDLITYEFENVPVAAASFLAARTPLFPPPAALHIAQDRLSEKTRFGELLMPTPEFAAVDTDNDLRAAIERIGLPAVLKTRRLGYDGKGQLVLRTHTDMDAAWAQLGGTPLILESFVAFRRELSILSVRGRDGATAFYPLVENEHSDGILRCSRAPASATRDLQETAQRYATALLESLDYVGVLAIEFFEKDGQLLANEMAPRVHNSGHWTIEGAETSQFENHVRAITGLLLGSTAPLGHSAMLNILGTIPFQIACSQFPARTSTCTANLPHRVGSWAGYVTITASDHDTLEERLAQVRGIIEN